MEKEIFNYFIDSLNLSPEKVKLILTHPTESRFKELFTESKPKKKRKRMLVDPKNIMLGLDKRTSIIIKNIPDYLTEERFKKIVYNFCSVINFFYIPNTIKTRKKLRVAFVNVVYYKQIVPIYMGLIYKVKFLYNNPNIEMEICYSKVQGKTLLLQRFFPNINPNLYLIKDC